MTFQNVINVFISNQILFKTKPYEKFIQQDINKI